MMPIAPLMIEHRLIERMISLIQREGQRLASHPDGDLALVDTAVDFIRTYADRCHHGKEEGILFRDLREKNLSAEHAGVLQELIDEHNWARNKVLGLISAKTRFADGDREAAREVASIMRELAEFYPKHIEKEDKRFFIPVMDYFSEEEKATMLAEEFEFDRGLIHEKYRQTVETLEKAKLKNT